MNYPFIADNREETPADRRRRLDRERKRAERAMNTPYAQRVRAAKRDAKRKARRKELRQRPEQKAKERAYIAEFRNRPEQKKKNAARSAVNVAIQSGKIVRPDHCELCGKPDEKLRDGRTGLRADHYNGYDRPLDVRFVCVSCDGEQERARGNTTLGKRIAEAAVPLTAEVA